jgi:phosphomethylpyrimidine synthase
VQPISSPSVKVAKRRIGLTDGSPVTVYDTSGPFTDPKVEINVHQGLADLRTNWIEKRADTELYQGRQLQTLDNGYQTEKKAFEYYNPKLQRQPRRAKRGQNVSQLHYARQGIITPEMKFVATNENQRRESLNIEFNNQERDKRLAGNA